MKEFLNTLYFSSAQDSEGAAVSKYEGVVVGFVVKRDDGTEYTIREEKPLVRSGRKLTLKDLEKLPTGSKLKLKGLEPCTVLKVYPKNADVWVQLPTANKVVKYWDLTTEQ